MTEVSGPHLVMLGAIHGNETCGSLALRRLLKAIDQGEISLCRGRLDVIPVCNPRAYEKGVRFIERNLNRYLVMIEQPNCYEARLGNLLVPILSAADVVLDLHSSPKGREPYVFVGPHRPDEFSFAASLGLRTLMNGWEEAYATTGRDAALQDPAEGIGTEQVLRRKGGLAALVECGVHEDPAAQEVAFQAICGALAHFDMARGVVSPRRAEEQRLVTIQKVFYRDAPGRLARSWEDFDPVRAGEPLAFLDDGHVIAAPGDGVVVLPDPNAQMGQEWFYFGVDTPLSAADFDPSLARQSAIA